MTEKIFLYEKLSSLLSAGLDIRKALDLSHPRPGKARRLVESAIGDIENGSSLAEALSGRGLISEFETALIKAGEFTGTLPEILRTLAEHFRKRGKWKRKIATGLVYPFFLFHLAVLLPPVYLLFIDEAGKYFSTIAWPLSIFYLICLLLLAGRKVFRDSALLSGLLEKLVWILPIIGSAAKNFAVARFLRILAISLKAGITPEKALIVSAQASSGIIERKIQGCPPDLLFREGISGVIRKSRILPEEYISVIKSGEDSGSAEESLSFVSEHIESSAETVVDRAVIIVPVLIYIGAALYIAAIVIGFYSRLYGSLGMF